ncbi:galactoside 2-alpha-L-fucosyltransferase SEC1-like isoform X3 [Mercenaria mercenaria]|uniref:galactoside 2-alpha-L-fucosyltransferase SEC1-like isoform X3 n=1 Tax=Mercenaria mercenaria TaxID=6596 RepID=UPI00234F1E05|nr:galactoside 2-alpha-L-fucosyltransferase SEC1-like isoform X3 [Mercenaria mercenaria]
MRAVYIYMSATVFFIVIAYTCLVQRKMVYKENLKKGVHYVCQTFNGRLANHIYQYASIYGISRLNNLTVILGKDDDLVEYFEVPSAEIYENRDMCQAFVEKYAKHCCVFDETFMNLPKNKNYKLGVYLQSWKYFQHVFEEVRTELKFKKQIQENAAYIVNSYKDGYSVKYGAKAVVFGVHIRRGDIASNRDLGGVRLVPDSYIRNAVDYVLKHFDHVVFLVCSDDIDHAKKVMNYRNISAEFVHLPPIHDLAILSNCDHVLTTSGSFGWWAGFLSRGTVLYYKYPMKEGTFERSEYNYNDFFPPDWIGLA